MSVGPRTTTRQNAGAQTSKLDPTNPGLTQNPDYKTLLKLRTITHLQLVHQFFQEPL